MMREHWRLWRQKNVHCGNKNKPANRSAGLWDNDGLKATYRVEMATGKLEESLNRRIVESSNRRIVEIRCLSYRRRVLKAGRAWNKIEALKGTRRLGWDEESKTALGVTGRRQ